VSKTEVVVFDLGIPESNVCHIHWDYIIVNSGDATFNTPKKTNEVTNLDEDLDHHDSVFSVNPCETCTSGTLTF
jgi:hypothetical protein